MRTDKAGCGHLFYPCASVVSVVKNPLSFKFFFLAIAKDFEEDAASSRRPRPGVSKTPMQWHSTRTTSWNAGEFASKNEKPPMAQGEPPAA